MLITLLRRAFASDKQQDSPNLTTCSHRSDPSVESCSLCKDEKHAAAKYRRKLVLGLILPFSLQAFDSTIIASALPWIARDFGEGSQFNWIASAFNLTSAAFIPFWGQMADVFGRNASLNAALVIMLIGSALCTGAPKDAFAVLLLGRGFQGVAAAGLNVLVRTILADKVTLAENAKNWTVLALVGGISYSIGPVIGGYMTKASWRWCFAINLPIAVLALLVVVFVLRKELLGPQPIPEVDGTIRPGHRLVFMTRLKTIDFGGQIMFLLGFALVILSLTWGGATYPWSSAAVLAPLVLGCVLVGCFIYWERLLSPGRALSKKLPWQKAMIPWSILTHKDIGLVWWTECLSGVALYAVLFFCNIYFITVKGYSSDESGVQLLYFVPGLGGGVILCSLLCNSWPRMTFPAVFLGTTVETIGIGLLAWAMYTEQTTTVYGMMALVGVGLGLRSMAAPLHGLGIFRDHRAAVVGLLSVAIPLGGTLGVTVMSTVFNNVSGVDSNRDSFAPSPGLSKEAQEQAVHRIKMGVVWAFVAITPLMLSGWVCACFLGNVRLSKEGREGDGPRDSDVLQGVFLLSLLKGQQMPDEERDVALTKYQTKMGSSAGPAKSAMKR